MVLEFSGRILEKYSNIKFSDNSSSYSRIVLCSQTDVRTDMTRLKISYTVSRSKEMKQAWIKN